VIVSNIISHLWTINFQEDFAKRLFFDLARNTQKHFPELKTGKNVFMKNRRAPEAPPPFGQQRVKQPLIDD